MGTRGRHRRSVSRVSCALVAVVVVAAAPVVVALAFVDDPAWWMWNFEVFVPLERVNREGCFFS